MKEIPNETVLETYEYPRICPYCSMSREYEVIRELTAPIWTADREIWELCKCHDCGTRFVRHKWWDYARDSDGRHEVRAFSTNFLPTEVYLRIHSVRYDERNDCDNCAHSRYVTSMVRDWDGQCMKVTNLRCFLFKVPCESRQKLPGQCPRWTRLKGGNSA